MSNDNLPVVPAPPGRRSNTWLEMSRAQQFMEQAMIGLMYAEFWDMLSAYDKCISAGGSRQECMEAFYPEHLKSVREIVDLPFPPPGPYVPPYETLKVLHSELSSFLAFIEEELPMWKEWVQPVDFS